jgi:hypothetical protein
VNREELLTEHRAMESEGDRSPTSKHVVDPHLEDTIDIELLAVQRMLDGKWLARLQTISPQEFGQLTAVEQRTWTDRAERFAKRFAEIHNWMSRNAPAKPEIPKFLRRQA